MADNLTDFIENALLEHVTGRTALAAPTHTYLALFTVAPTDSTFGTEVPLGVGAYERRQLTWGAASGGAISLSSAVRFPATGGATTNWGTVVALGIMNAATGSELSNLWWYGTLSTVLQFTSGSNYTVQSGGLTLTLS